MLDFFSKGGVLMYPIALCSFFGVAIFFNKLFEFRKIFKDFEKSVDEIMHQKPYMILPIIEAIENGAKEREISLIGTKQIKKIERGLSWLALIATIAPLLGLTGTVTGMIKAFMVISSTTSVNPSMLASGIWEALITTAAGLIVAIPIHVGHHYLEKKADDIALIMREMTISIMTRIKNGV